MFFFFLYISNVIVELFFFEWRALKSLVMKILIKNLIIPPPQKKIAVLNN